mgnify:CR=1 FL=1
MRKISTILAVVLSLFASSHLFAQQSLDKVAVIVDQGVILESEIDALVETVKANAATVDPHCGSTQQAHDRQRCQAFATAAFADIKIAHVYGKTGPFEAYAKQSHDGLMLGLEYATGGTMEINGEKIVVIEKDTQLKPENGKALLEEAYGDDEVDLAVGPVSSGVALAMLPVAEEFEKVLIVEPAVADSITGSNWNRYIFRTSRNSSQDAVANAIALSGENVHIATLAQDYAFGRDQTRSAPSSRWKSAALIGFVISGPSSFTLIYSSGSASSCGSVTSFQATPRSQRPDFTK